LICVSYLAWDLLVNGTKAVEGLRPSFSAHVRFGERGAPVRFPPKSDVGQAKPQISPLRYAPVEMTILFCVEDFSFQETNSAAALERVALAIKQNCHLDRSVA
jgi:hypothetical protein